MQEKVNNWIANGCIFSEGVAILASTGKFKHLVKSISGRPHRYSDKLKYELLKLAAADAGIPNEEYIKSFQNLNQLDPASVPQSVTDIPGQNSNTVSTKSVSDGKKEQLPPEVEKITKIYADAYKTRAILHDSMAKIPSVNTAKNIQERKKLSDQIHECSLVIDTMHKAKDNFYVNGILPDVEKLIASYTEKSNLSDLPDSAEDLKKLKQDLQAYSSKDQFLLEYQQNTKGEHKNPMPPGPKRTKIELRLKSRLELLNLIELKLHEIS